MAKGSADGDFLDAETRARLGRLLARVEHRLPAAPGEPLPEGDAWRWRRGPWGGRFEAVSLGAEAEAGDLVGLDHARDALVANTAMFADGHPANHALLWGPRGTGKSSLVRAVGVAFADRGVRLVAVDRPGLAELPEILAHLAEAPWRFLLFVDDLAFEPGDPSYRELKAALDGGLGGMPGNVIVYATSNRRHLMPDPAETLFPSGEHGELFPGEGADERVSLSERFGLWLGFRPMNQDLYLEAARHWVGAFGGDPDDATLREAALRWSLARGARSGRTARQFAVDFVGRPRVGRGDGGDDEG